MFVMIRNLVFCLLTLTTTAMATSDDHFQVTTLAPDLLMISTDQGSYSNNSLIFTGPDGLLLVDTHHDDDAEAFRSFVEDLGLGTPKYIINTHRHIEHIGGNHLFGLDPIVVAHQLFPEKLRSGTFLFSEYPPEAFPDITFADSLEITFNNEIIRLVDIGGSHDDNEILVHFTKHGVAHTSSVVNGFNFPSVDGDGDVLQFEAMTRQLMTLLPRDTRLVSGHNGQATGYDFVGSWDQLPAYANMMKETVDIVRRELAEGKSQEDMEAAGIFAAYEQYAGSYVSTNGWINYVVDALTVPRETRDDICKPVYKVWKQDGAAAAVAQYQHLLMTQEDQYDFSQYVLMSIGSKLYANKRYEDAVTFLLGSSTVYPESEYGYYTHYLAAKGLQKLGRTEEAIVQCRESVRLKDDFDGARSLLDELTGKQAQNLLDEPQKIVVDAGHDRLLVSNFGNGAIVQIDNRDNQTYFIEDAGFVDGLEIVGNTVFGVGHARKLYAYDLDTGERVLDFHFEGSDEDYLSSVTSDLAGHLFISCPALHTIYKFSISDHSYQVFAQGNGLNRPNGILLEKENNRIVVIDDSPDSSIIHAISLSDATVSTLATTSFDRPDGIVRDGSGEYYIGGYYLPGLYKIDADFSKQPEMIFKGSHMVYPTYDPRDHSLLITYYGSNGWDRIKLGTATELDER